MVGVLLQGSLARGDERGVRANMKITNVSIARDADGQIRLTSFIQTTQPAAVIIVTLHIASDGNGSFHRIHSDGGKTPQKVTTVAFNNPEAADTFNGIYNTSLQGDTKRNLDGKLSDGCINKLVGAMDR